MRDKLTIKPTQHIFVALDTIDLTHALDLAQMLKGRVGGVKIGKEFFISHGPAGTRMIADEGLPIFLDLKFHDIPSTVAGAVRASIPLKPFILNVHAAGGRAMMESARDAAAEEADSRGIDRPLILGVTVLTSLDEGDFKEIGFSGSTNDQVRRLANLAQESGLDGVVCSASEIELLRTHCGKEFKLLTPGIRPDWADVGDQKRVVSPLFALSQGADFLVIGRAITCSQDPVMAISRIEHELQHDG